MQTVDLYQWTAWKFGNRESRLSGYILTNEGLKHVMSEAIVRVDGEEGIVHTENVGVCFRPLAPEGSNRINTMYELGRWCQLQERVTPREITEQVLVDLKKEKVVADLKKEKDSA